MISLLVTDEMRMTIVFDISPSPNTYMLKWTNKNKWGTDLFIIFNKLQLMQTIESQVILKV